MDDLKDPRILAYKEALLVVFHGKETLQSIAFRRLGVTKLTVHNVCHSFGGNHLASQPLSINEIYIPIDFFTGRCPNLSNDDEKLIFDTAINFSMTG